MADPLTVQFGPWVPDLQNVATQVPYTPVPFPVPLADCLNVYYQDGTYRCLPSLAATGPSLGQQVFGAFTWYDDTGNQEMVFAGTANGIYALADGAWTQVPLFISTTVTLSGNSITVTPGSFKYLFGATMVAGSGTQVTGYQSGVFGTLTPTTDSNGHTITQIYDTSHHTPPANTFSLVIGTAGLGQSYFSSMTIQPLGVTLSSSSATYTSAGGTSSWTWGAIGINAGVTYQVALFA